MEEKNKIVSDIEGIALALTSMIENCDSITENDNDYWFFYHMLCVAEQMLEDSHQYAMMYKDNNPGLTQVII